MLKAKFIVSERKGFLISCKLFDQYVQNGQQNDVQSADGLKTGITIKSSFATAGASGSEDFHNSVDEALILKRKSEDVAPYLCGRCIYLVGMMGSGKTTVGKIISEVLGYSFFDSDKLVEQAVGMSSVAQIFKEHSEAFFRDNESEVLKDLSSMRRLVVAIGGGAVIRPINWRYMKQGITVWLDVPLEALAKRIAAVGTDSRPLLHEEPGDPYTKVLPLVPPGRRANEDGSPYAGQDANCGNTLLISLEELVKDGLLMKDELPEPMEMERVQFKTISEIKDPLIAKAAERLILSQGKLKEEYERFCKDPGISGWLEDAAFFAAIDRLVDTYSWHEWPEPLKNRHLRALVEIYQSEKHFMDIFTAEQFLFQRQWQRVRAHAKGLGIKIMGDMPIYVGYHSADVWANRSSFLLDRSGFPVLVSGVPPDAFSETGQLWGSPLYDWRAMEHNGFAWWIKRIKRAIDLYDEFRIDHFRGFAGFWAVPSEAKIATCGRWKTGPRKAFFDAIFKALGEIDIIAEDLGVITEDVVQLRKDIGAPGMAVLQFAFGSDPDNPHLPHNHEPNQVVYTGTHDNDTILGWWQNISDKERCSVQKYLWMANETNISWAMIHAAIASVARITIIPMQDILGLGSDARMNTPATQLGNWRWRIPSSMSFDRLESEAQKLRDLLFTYNRL